MVKVKVPATTANIGPGFDCLGMALELFNIIEVEEIKTGLEIIIPDKDRKYIENDENNLVYQSMKFLFDEVDYHPKGLRITLMNNIPLTRGLGSSAACIAGGLVAANELIGKPLTNSEIIFSAAKMDGHPDNVLPALIGGMTIGCLLENEVKYVKIDLPSQLKILVLIPNFHFPTKKARSILPKSLPFEDAVFNLSRLGLLVSSLMTHNFDNLPIALQDKIHQPYRKDFIPHWNEITSKLLELGSKGFFISGAGPSIVGFLDKDYEKVRNKTVEFLSKYEENWEVEILNVSNSGLEVINSERSNECH